MEPRAHHVMIGLFTLAVCVAAVLFALWLGKSKNSDDTSYYTVVFNEAVRGLSKGSAVQYNGIRIGDVVDLSLDRADLRTVKARVRVDSKIPITQDTKARLVLTGITGVSVIEFSGGTPDSPRLEAQEGSDPVIVASPSPLSQLLSGGDDLMTNLGGLISNAKEALSPENIKSISGTLAHLEKITGTFADRGEDVDDFMQKLTGLSTQATEAFAQVSTLMDSTNQLVKKQGTAMFDHAEKALASLNNTSAQLSKLIEDNQQALSQGISGFTELGPALDALRETLNAIQYVTRKLDDNPANYLLGREKIQEFQP